MRQNYWKSDFRQYSDTPQRQYITGQASGETEITLSEAIHITRPYPLGSTVMISLGLIIVLFWTLFQLIPALLLTATNRHAPLAYRSVKSDDDFGRTELRTRHELQQEFSKGIHDYKQAQSQFYPEPTAKVYLRGKVVCNYHWHKSCPVFSTKSAYGKKQQPTITMTRLQAESKRKVPCSYCCEIGNAE